jgi:copper resistance protein B
MIAAALAILLWATPQHTGHPQQPPTPRPQQQQEAKPPVEDHSAHVHPTAPPTTAPKEPVPAITDADRLAAFPPGLEGHAVHDRLFNTFVLFDRLEWLGDASGGLSIENRTWLGGDMDRVWLRAAGRAEDGRLDGANVHALYGRSFSRWWDVVAGVRQDFRPGDPQTWAAVGIQGLAPYWFEVEATGYVGTDWRTHARVEVEYDLLLTNRLVLQPVVEFDVYGKRDVERGVDAGLSSIEAGARLRYEIRRELAPYVGIVWDRKLLGTADLAREKGDDVGGLKLAVGIRTWF